MSLKDVLPAIVFAAVLHGAADARADALIDEYDAYIGFEDTYNSRGDTLTEPWQVIQQDRANDHRYGITQRGDAPDDFLASAQHRAMTREMMQGVSFSASEFEQIVGGFSAIHVSIYRSESDGDDLEVEVNE